MPHTKPDESQYSWEGRALIHKPTGAKWSIYPNGAPSSVNWGRAGDVLPSGEDYDRGDLERLALFLIEKKNSG